MLSHDAAHMSLYVFVCFGCLRHDCSESNVSTLFFGFVYSAKIVKDMNVQYDVLINCMFCAVSSMFVLRFRTVYKQPFA